MSAYSEQYSLSVAGGSSFQFIGSPGNDGWYDAGSTAQVTSNYVWNVAPGSRQNLYSYSVDGSSPTIVPRSGTGIYVSVGVTMNSPHAISLNAVSQYQLTVNGGNGITYSTPSQTNDGWYDAGSSLTISTNFVWGVVAGQSRLNLASWSLDGGANRAAVRSGSGTFTTSPITMDNPHTATFDSVTQYYVATAASIPRNGSISPLNMSYSYTSPSTSTSYLNCPGFECEPTGSMPNNPWFNVNSGAVIVSSEVHSGTKAAYTYAPNAGPYQSIGLPPHATITSISFSAWIYGSQSANGGSPAQIGVNCGGYQDATLATVSDDASGDSGFSLYSGSWAGSCSPPMNEDAVCSYSNLGGFSIASPCVTIFGRAGQCGRECLGNGGVAGTAYLDDFAWTVDYFSPVSGSAGSTANTYSVNGMNVTYSYGVGYSFPAGSSSPSWSASWSPHSSESYSSSTCAGSSVSGDSIAGTRGPCTLTTASSGTVPITISSPTGDGWLDSGVAAPLVTSPTGPFSFASWNSGTGGIAVGSSNSSSTTVTATSFGTITANFQVNQ